MIRAIKGREVGRKRGEGMVVWSLWVARGARQRREEKMAGAAALRYSGVQKDERRGEVMLIIRRAKDAM